MIQDFLWPAIITASGAILATIVGQVLSRILSKKPKDGKEEIDARIIVALKAKDLLNEVKEDLVKEVSSKVEESNYRISQGNEAIQILNRELDKCHKLVNKLTNKP